MRQRSVADAHVTVSSSRRDASASTEATHRRYIVEMATREARDASRIRFSHFDLLEPATQAGREPLDGGLVMDQDLAVRVDDPKQPHVIELVIVPWEGRLEAGRVTVTRRNDASPPVDHKALRFPLASYVAGAVAEYLRRPTSDPDELMLTARIGRGRGGRPTFFHALGHDDQEPAASGLSQMQGRRRGKRATLVLAAELYLEALGDPLHRRAPTQYVADKAHWSRGHASRLLTEARRANLLGPARGTRGGELHPPTPRTHHEPGPAPQAIA